MDLAVGCQKGQARDVQVADEVQGLFFLGKDPDGETGWPDGAPAAEEEWEHRKIMGIVWMNRKGWGVETKVATDLRGGGLPYRSTVLCSR